MNPFGIAPLLDRGFRLDPYERFLIAKIKTGQYCADLWDCNGLYYPERRGLPVYGTPLRYEITPERLAQAQADAAARRAAWLADAPGRAERRQERAAAAAKRKAEWERIQREWDEARARKLAEKQRRDAEWAASEAELEARWQEREAAAEEAYEAAPVKSVTDINAGAARRRAERKRILAAPWQCKKCLKPATIEPYLGGFRLKCLPCDESTFGDHELLARVVEAQAP